MDREGCDPVVWGPAAFQKENTRLSLVGAKRHLTGGQGVISGRKDQCGPGKTHGILSSSLFEYPIE